jgi:non-ribosomal peptide synthetase component F
MVGVHRIVEKHAAHRGNEVAFVGAGRVLTYRELNQRANGLARFLIEQGLRRGARAVVKMERGPDLAVALLAVLKAGAAYTWLDVGEDSTWSEGISLVRDIDGVPRAHAVLAVRDVVEASARPAPNLPIVTRGHDIACVMPQRNGLPGVVLPHATIAALQCHPVPSTPRWSADPSALDLWIPLMAGTAAILTRAPAAAAA